MALPPSLILVATPLMGGLPQNVLSQEGSISSFRRLHSCTVYDGTGERTPNPLWTFQRETKAMAPVPGEGQMPHVLICVISCLCLHSSESERAAKWTKRKLALLFILIRNLFFFLLLACCHLVAHSVGISTFEGNKCALRAFTNSTLICLLQWYLPPRHTTVSPAFSRVFILHLKQVSRFTKPAEDPIYSTNNRSGTSTLSIVICSVGVAMACGCCFVFVEDVFRRFGFGGGVA